MEQPNLNYIEELAAGSDAFKQKLIAIVKREFPEEKETFLSNYQAKRYELTAENVHKLKHKIGMLGFEKGYEVAIAFENELKDEEYSLYPDFIRILESIEAFLIKI
ncbi:Hpt domain-containing protein [Aquimarina sp. ERC-38]|uniref:Hpt domain-containing protein n=1 Tax=Aquimarina sp. ERC-38 TaxID=2949996 RepID=UPI002247B698|nr:Hpt domain-containing protein [Aquimarina sp. ERC-38]UZO82254.1 Hpt domain-containing protein [Aquimarina sp. ERC-38]